MRGQMSSAHVHVETSHCHIAMTSSKQFGISGVQRCAILSHDIESLSHGIGSLSHDNKPFPHGFDSFPYRFNGATIGFRPSTIAFVLDPSDSKSLRYNSALDSCALAADSSLFTPGRHRSGAGKTVHEAWMVTASKKLRVHIFFRCPTQTRLLLRARSTRVFTSIKSSRRHHPSMRRLCKPQ